MRTAVFGGTFNPPHLGHVKLARGVIDKGYADNILFIPAFRPPHKTGMVPAPFADRVRMLNLALRDFSAAEVSTVEERRSEVLSYTFDTMMELSAEQPNTNYIILIGEDSLAQLHHWYMASSLVEKWPILTYPRSGETVSLNYLMRYWPEQTAKKLIKGKIELPIYNISATAIRDALGRGDPTEELLDHEVFKYIKEKQLYR